MNSARANAMRMRQPPLNSFVFFCCFSGVNPSPLKIFDARVSAVDASSSSKRSYTCVKRSMASSLLSSAATMSLSSSASFSKMARSLSTLITASFAVMSVASISSFKWKMSMPSGMGKHRAAITRMNVDLPHPFRPM